MYKKMHQKGFTLIETLVALFIFSIIALTFAQTYSVGTRVILDSKNRLGAVALANQRMEVIRSLNYDQIGTKSWNGTQWLSGIPAGDIISNEQVNVNTRGYHVETSVQYVDDALDGVEGGSPSDDVPTDYKRVRVMVSWGNETKEEQVELFGDFAPQGVESATAGGTLLIQALDSAGLPVSGASVRVENTDIGIDASYTTNTDGVVSLPGTPPGTQNYKITVSKASYFGVNTWPPYPTTSYTPVDTHATVIADTINQFSIIFDQSISYALHTVDPFDTDIPGAHLSWIGGRLLGTNPTTGNEVYSTEDSSITTNSNGKYAYTNVSPGLYKLVLQGASLSKYELYKLLPETAEENMVADIVPGFSGDIKVVLLDKEIGSLKLVVEDEDTGLPVEGASVQLTNTTLGYDATGTTDQFGWAYFPRTNIPLESENYTIQVGASGYSTKTDTVDIDGALVTKTIQIKP